MKQLGIVFFVAALMALMGCSDNKKWTIKGSVVAAEGDTIFIKHLVDNQYHVLGERVIKSNGKFSFSLEKKTFPEFYFLQVNQSPYLVVVRDSSDLVELSASSADISKAQIMGSPASQRIQESTDRIKSLRREYLKYKNATEEEQEAMGGALLDYFKEVKQVLAQNIIDYPKSMSAYYILYQRLDEENLLFSPYNDDDYRYFAAVATSFDVFRKDDPRTKALHDVVMSALETKRNAALREMVANAPEGIPDIVKLDANGVEHKLSDLKGKVVILNFWMSQSRESLAFNEALKQLYSRYHRRGLEVFQVSSDQSKLLWTEAVTAAKLPWINVCECSSDIDQDFVTYNVRSLPTTYLVGRDGNMINRFTSAKALEDAIKGAL